MGTNYYVKSKRCKCCRHQPEELHIGKSSAGWCFSLHVVPEMGLNSWEDWLTFLEAREIVDEYGDILALIEFRDIVELRSWRDGNWPDGWWKHFNHYASEEDFHNKNQSKRGPNGLLRARVDGWHCVGNGEGTWDYIAGEFS